MLLYHSNAGGSSLSSSGQLVEHLISTAIIRGHSNLALALAATPAAQQLDVQAVTKLLYVRISSLWVPAQQLTSQQLCELLQQLLVPRNKEYWVPQQQQDGFSTATVEQLLLDAAQQQRLGAVTGLLTLRAAARLSREVLTELLQHAVQEVSEEHYDDEAAPPQCDDEAAPRFALETMHPSLLHLPAAQQPSADDVVRVLTAAVEALTPNHTGVASVCALPGALLVGAEAALALLQRAGQRGYQVWVAALNGMPQLADLPAEQLGAAKALGPDAVAALMAACLEDGNAAVLVLVGSCQQQRSSTSKQQRRWQLPAAVQGAFSQGAVRQLLLAAFEAQQWGVFGWLVGLPAAPWRMQRLTFGAK
ncbi:hypothetical protein COO60DRAFT_1686771 [Scenedesmus sp. NREL 46B-D3]|nr:hypothetical protein COO60DRAFT_1686771 [Scenedesmus sp. NREL 46B-D3]